MLTGPVRISFSPAMVNALIDGAKIETRRLAVQVKDGRAPSPAIWFQVPAGTELYVREPVYREAEEIDARTGTRLQELICYRADGDAAAAPVYRYRHGPDRSGAWASAALTRLALSLPDGGVRWGHPRFMPMWATRLTLTLEGVEREPLHAITDDGAVREGATEREGLWSMDWTGIGRWHKRLNRALTLQDIGHPTPLAAFTAYWNYLHSPKGSMTDRPWRENPELAVLRFRVNRAPHPRWTAPA